MYCKTTLLKEIKTEVKTKTKEPVIPEGWTGLDKDYNQWAKEVLLQQPEKKLRQVSQQY